MSYAPSTPSTGKLVQETVNQIAHGLSAKQAVGLSGAGLWVAALSVAAGPSMQGLVTSVIDANNFIVATFGAATVAGHGSTVGQWYWLSQVTAGAVTVTTPTGGTMQQAFFVRDANTLEINVGEPVGSSATSVNDQAASGFVDIGAMRIQWGQSTTSGAALVVTFPAPFANTNYQWTGTVNLGSTTANYIGMTYSSKALGSITVFGQQFNTGSSTIIAASGQTFSWIAIGLHP